MVATQPTNQYVIRISYMTTNPNCISKCIDVIFTFANISCILFACKQPNNK